MSRKVGFAVKKVGSGSDKLLAQISELSKNQVEVGHFAIQGQHPTAEMSYVDLMKFHASGRTYVVRDPIAVLKWMTKRIPTQVYGGLLRQFFSNPSDKKSLVSLFDSIGKYLSDKEKSIFGNPAYLQATSLNLDPLVDTGALVDAVSYRNTIDKRLKQ